MSTRPRKVRPSVVMAQHYFRLAYRTALFLVLGVIYIRDRMHGGGNLMDLIDDYPIIIALVWIVFAIEMIQRFFPSSTESPGCQKQFASNYIKSGSTEIDIPGNHASVLIAMIWVLFNGIFGALHMAGIFDDGIMILLCCAYSVCDIICILFFCPFQAWFLKNKCCCTCRIYNWDYPMMFTPLFFVPGVYTWSLLGLSVLLLMQWEIKVFRHPERFSDKTNDYLRCSNCSEKLCAHKKHLKKFWKEIAEFTETRLQKLQ